MHLIEVNSKLQNFFKLFKFFFQSSLKTWSFYVYSGLFLFLWCFYIYIYPLIEDGKSLIEIFRYKHILAFVILFLVIDIVSMTAKTFSASWYDGSELLILTKPVSRTQILWSKILVIACFIVTLAGLTAISSIFTTFTPSSSNDVSVAITLGGFVAVIVIGFIFASLAVLISMFMKPMGTVLVVVGIQALLLTLQIILNVLVTSPGRTLENKYKIKMDDVALVSKPNDNNQVGYQQATFMLKNDRPITLDTKFNGVPLKVSHSDLSTFAQTVYFKEANLAKRNVMTYIDIQKQWANLFLIYPEANLKTDPMLRQENGESIFNNIFNSSNESFYWSPEFNNLGMQTILETYNVESIANSKYNFQLVSSGTITVNQYKGGDIDNRFYAQTNNPEYNGTFTTELTSLSFPIFKIDEKTKNWKVQTFNNYSDFGQYYFASQAQNATDFIQVLKEANFKQLIPSTGTYYFSLLANWWYNQNPIDFNNLKNKEVNIELNGLQDLLFNFQYHTFKLLQDWYNNKSNYPWMGNDALKIAISLLNFDLTEESTKYYSSMKSSIYLGNPQEYKTALQEDNLIKPENLKNWYSVQTQLSLLPQVWLQTLTLPGVKPAINPVYTTIFWLTFSLVILLVSASLYAKKDIT